jgi:hypothetical protein
MNKMRQDTLNWYKSPISFMNEAAEDQLNNFMGLPIWALVTIYYSVIVFVILCSIYLAMFSVLLVWSWIDPSSFFPAVHRFVRWLM